MFSIQKMLKNPKKEFWFYRGLSLLAITVFVVVLLINSFFLSQTKPKRAESATGSKTLTTQADWEEGTITGNVSTTQSPGDLVLEKQIQLSASWTPDPFVAGYLTANPNVANIDNAAVVSNGTNVYVVGGENYPTCLNRLDRYNVSSDDWTVLAVIPKAISRGAAAFSNDKIYFFGGMDTGFGAYNTNSYIYDISGNSWSNIASISYGRELGTAVVVNGNIYFYGGNCDTVTEPNCYRHINVYSIPGNSWSNITTTTTLVSGAVGGQIGSDLYVVGGMSGPGSVTNLAYKFNWGTSDWGAIDTLNQARGLPLVVGLLDEIYVYGGEDGVGNPVGPAERYNPDTNTFTNLVGGNITRSGTQINNSSVDDRAYTYGGTVPPPPYGTNNFINRYPIAQEYLSPGTHTAGSTQIDGSVNLSSWDTFTASETKPVNTSITYRARSSTNGSSWSSWVDLGSYTGTPKSLASVPARRYLQIESTLSTTDITVGPALHDYTVNYSTTPSPPPPNVNNGNENDNGNDNGTINGNANGNGNGNDNGTDGNDNENNNENFNYNRNYNRNENRNGYSPPPDLGGIKIITQILIGPLIAISILTALWPWLLNLLAVSPVLDNILSYIYFYLNQFFEMIGLRKRRSRFGIIYDSGTKKPIPFVLVRILDAKEEALKETTVTQKNGTFGFLIPSGEYFIKTYKAGYHFPSEKVFSGEPKNTEEGKTKFVPGRRDNVYENIYLGELIKIKAIKEQNEEGKVTYLQKGSSVKEPLEISIPIDKTKERGFSYFALTASKKISRILKLIGLPLLIVGTTISVFLLIARGHLFDLLAVLVYVLVWGMEIASYLKNKSYGEVLNERNKKPLDLVLIKLREVVSNKIEATYITGKDGRFILQAKPGKYFIEAHKEDYKMIRTKSFKLKSAYDLKGMMIKMKKR